MRLFRQGDRRRRGHTGERLRVAFVLCILLLLEFYLRPSVVAGQHGLPDFLILVLLLLAIREEPGVGALTGFVIGLVIDVMNPAHFGAGMLANVLVGWGAAWGRSIFFADNIFVNGALFFIGTWVRDVLMALFSGTPLRALPLEVLLWSPLQALSTAAVGVLVVIFFRDWLAIRIET
jgi:rod shape-determining protein MreD